MRIPVLDLMIVTVPLIVDAEKHVEKIFPQLKSKLYRSM